ncbi:MAG: hypothetical protein KME12_12295 [Trichocoleus desertorum ATA4-8-CV12]|jgi:hypothetical protein|nr:hypothetical protein [Trichocoleus desertorum ATA4-8-CV12]
MSAIPDCISTLELSKLWIYKALKEIEAEREQEQSEQLEPEQSEQSDKEG